MDKQLLHEFLDAFYDDFNDYQTAIESGKDRDFWELGMSLERCYPELMADYVNIWEAIQGGEIE